MKRLTLLTMLSFLLFGLSAQINKYGAPQIKNYSIETTGALEYNWSIVKDKTGVIYFANDYRGIVRYDGNRWSLIQLRNEALVRTLGIDSLGVIYVGGSFEFGYLEPSLNGHMNYVSISKRFEEPEDINDSNTSTPDSSVAVKVQKKKVNIGDIVSMVVTDSTVYFAGYESLFIYNKAKDSVEYINLRNYNLTQVVKFVAIGNRIFLAGNSTGLYELKNGKPEMLPGGDYFKGKICMVILPYDESRIFIGTYSDGVYLFDFNTGIVTTDFLSRAINDLLKNAAIYTALDLPTGERILGTLNEGVFVFSREGELLSLWNKETTDLQDNTVTALYAGGDKNSELWISTAGFISTAYINAPYTEFTKRLGYEGFVNNITKFGSSIYVSTDLGLFRSKITGTGLLGFEKFKDISNTVFVLFNAISGKEESLLVGSNPGLYQILKDGSLIRVDSELKVTKGARPKSFYVRSITQSKINSERFYLGQASAGIAVLEYSKGEWRHIRNVKSSIRCDVTTMFEDEKGDLMMYAGNPVGIYHLKLNDTMLTQFTSNDGLPNTTYFSMSKIGEDVFVSTGQGLFRYLADKKRWVSSNELTGGYTKDMKCLNIISDQDNDLWLTNEEDRIYDVLLRNDNGKIVPFRGGLNTLPNRDNNDLKFFDGRYWMVKSSNIYAIGKQKLYYPQPVIRTILTKIVVGNDSLLLNGSFYHTLEDGKRVPSQTQNDSEVPELKYNFYSITFSWTLPYYINEESTVFSYKLDGFDKEWSKWEKTYYATFTSLPIGEYKFMVKAINANGIESIEPATFTFFVKPPFYLTWWFILISFGILVTIISTIIRSHNLSRDKKILEKKVLERTIEISDKNLELEQKNRDITSSIVYAERIQRAILPRKELLDSLLKDYFIIFKPRDIVSGDFYWGTKIENISIIAAVDCTGHGVPGAFMSILGAAFLNEIINKEYITHPGVILRRLRKAIIHSLQQRGDYGEQKDGMDISLCAIDYENMKLQFAGANNPMYLIRDANSKRLDIEKRVLEGDFILYEIKGSKMPISIYDAMDNFTVHNIDILKGDAIYLFSDGFADQFGGSSGKKMQYKNFKKVLLNHSSKPMIEQMHLIGKDLEDWKGENNQIDDDLLIGFRI